MIPGGNILKTALSVLGKTSVLYFQFSSRVPNSAGIDVSTYLAGVNKTEGFVTAVKRENYKDLGLDLAKKYIYWYVPEVDVKDIGRGDSGDVIEVLDRRWQVVGLNDWYGLDGWKAALCIDIGAATALYLSDSGGVSLVSIDGFYLRSAGSTTNA